MVGLFPNYCVRFLKNTGLLSRVFNTPAETVTAAIELARVIATKSPVAVQGSKVNLNYARDHSVDEALLFHVRKNVHFHDTSQSFK